MSANRRPQRTEAKELPASITGLNTGLQCRDEVVLATENGVVSGCNVWAHAKIGDTRLPLCAGLANAAGPSEIHLPVRGG